jgi:hypothetical protein
MVRPPVSLPDAEPNANWQQWYCEIQMQDEPAFVPVTAFSKPNLKVQAMQQHRAMILEKNLFSSPQSTISIMRTRPCPGEEEGNQLRRRRLKLSLHILTSFCYFLSAANDH